MADYKNDSIELLEKVGGKDNVAAVTHCVTRMRFVLKDPDKANVEDIEKKKVVKGTFTQAGQFQVIIGNTVGEFYDDFIDMAGMSGVSKEEAKQAAKANQTWLQRLMSNLAEIFTPLIPALITGGLILGFRNCIDSIYFFENGTATLVDISQFWAGVDSFLWLIGEAVFHMLPVGICWSVVRKMGGTQILGIILGLTLVSGQLLNAYSVAETATADIPVWDFGFIQVQMIGYQAQVIPAILAAFAFVYLERFFKSITPQVVQMIFVPFFSIILAVMVSHFILGPIGWRIGSFISNIVYAGISGSFRVLFGAIFGFLYAPLVITGLHHMSNAIDLQLIADYGGTMLWPMIALSNIAQGSAVLAMSVLQKNDADAEEVNVPSCISCYLGVTEPALFGVNLKYTFPFICGMIGSSCAGILSTLLGVTANDIGVGGLPGILSIQPQYMLSFALCMAIAIAVPFVLTYLYGKRVRIDKQVPAYDQKIDNELVPSMNKPEKPKYDINELGAFLDGNVIDITEVADPVFASKTLGDGIAIEPTNNILVAPADGEVSVVMEGSNHAVGMQLPNGMEVLLHIGIDTVDMNGNGFEPHVKVGDTVKKGDKLISFDPSKIKAAGHPLTTMLVFTDNAGKSYQLNTGKTVKANQDVVVKIEN